MAVKADDYRLQADWDRDETWDHLDGNLSAYVEMVETTMGMAGSFDTYGAPAEMIVLLRNIDGLFHSEHANLIHSNCQPGTLVRFQVLNGGVWETLFEGLIRTIQPRVSADLARKQVVMLATGPTDSLNDAYYKHPFQADVRIDEVIHDMMWQPVITYPYASQYWVLDSAENSVLGVTTRLYNTNLVFNSLETGDTTIPWLDDTREEGGVEASGLIREMLAAEVFGRFYFNARAGKFYFQQRHRDKLQKAVGVQATLTEKDINLEQSQFVYGAQVKSDIKNKMTVSYQPRETGAADTVLWTSQQVPFRIGRGKTKKFRAVLHDANVENARVSLADGTIMQRGTDWTANRREDGSGKDETRNIVCSARFETSSAEVTVLNKGSRPVWVTKLQVRGQPLYTFDQEEVVRYNPDSMAENNLHPDRYDSSLVADADFAGAIAKEFTNIFGDPVPRFRTLTVNAFDNDNTLDAALTLTIGDYIRVVVPEYGHDSNYFIVGERHRIVAGSGQEHTTIWTLKHESFVRGAVLGVAGFSELGSTFYLSL